VAVGRGTCKCHALSWQTFSSFLFCYPSTFSFVVTPQRFFFLTRSHVGQAPRAHLVDSATPPEPMCQDCPHASHTRSGAMEWFYFRSQHTA
jgi:hypothetical protein